MKARITVTRTAFEATIPENFWLDGVAIGIDIRLSIVFCGVGFGLKSPANLLRKRRIFRAAKHEFGLDNSTDPGNLRLLPRYAGAGPSKPQHTNSVIQILEAGWHARMSSRLAGKGACACVYARFTTSGFGRRSEWT